MKIWISLVLLLAPLVPVVPVQAQTEMPRSEPTTAQDLVQSATPNVIQSGSEDPGTQDLVTSASPDEEAVRAAVDALIDAQADELLAQMGVEDKVGQLFLIHFAGNDTDILSDISVLIHAYRVGGVVLSPRYRNFTNQRGVDTPAEVATLSNQLQALAYGLLLPDAISLVDEENIPLLIETLPTLADELAEADRPPVNIPLFVGVEQMGDDFGVTSLRRGFTELPNQMTLGAAWNPELAGAVGEIVGQELSAVGVNLLLGPSLDMLVQPRPGSVGSLGVHMYGGNPYWVSTLGQAYVEGIHEGGNGELLTVARHFPGQGDVDRLPDQEVATIQSDIEELRAGPMAPFQAVTDGEPGVPSNTDMMMSSHMRFSGVQGTGPERVKPLGLSSELTTLLLEEGFGPWLEDGLIVSSPLDTPAIRRYYETDDGEFPARQVAQDAFVAGNDILHVGHFDDDEAWETERVNIESTISFFQERYENNFTFADQVDAAVRRILRSKLRLYADMDALEAEAIALLTQGGIAETGAITTGAVITGPTLLATPESASATQPTSPFATPPSPLVEQQDAIASSQTTPVIPLERLLVSNEQLAILNGESEHRKEANALVRQVARDSLTVLYPDISESTESLPQAPQAGDKIVIFTESRLEQECSDCTAEVAIGPDDIENIILRLHGPEATGQISPEQLTSLTFSELVEVLDSDASTEEADDADDAGDTITTLLPTPTPEAPAAADTDNTELDGEDNEASEPIDRSMQIEQDIDAADWLIFAMLDVDPAIYASDAVKRFLGERSEEIEGKKIVVLALQAPYFLDGTEISSLSGYLGAYSQSASFLENAVDAIFRSYTPYGSPPVSVSGTRFANLQERLHPDPLQVLGLKVLAEDLEIQRFDEEANSGIQPAIPVGSTIRIEVGPVLDQNGQTVPDDTLVYYQLIYQGEELALPVQSANTRNGMAVRDVTIEQEGTLLITASAGAATSGEPYELLAKNVDTAEDGDAATGETATSSESSAADPTAQAQDTTVGDPDGSATTGDGQGVSNAAFSDERVNLATLIVALLILVVTISLLLIAQNRIIPRPILVRNLLWTAIAGLAAYVLYGVGLLPGANWLHSYFGVIAAGIVVLVSMIATMLWLQLRSN